jgi:hypothetical protein
VSFGRETVWLIKNRRRPALPARTIKWICSMNDALQKLLALIKANDGINDKGRLERVVQDAFGLMG